MLHLNRCTKIKAGSCEQNVTTLFVFFPSQHLILKLRKSPYNGFTDVYERIYSNRDAPAAVYVEVRRPLLLFWIFSSELNIVNFYLIFYWQATLSKLLLLNSDCVILNPYFSGYDIKWLNIALNKQEKPLDYWSLETSDPCGRAPSRVSGLVEH